MCRNANMGADRRIMNRLWSFASSYMAPTDNETNSPAGSVHNTPRRQTPRRYGPSSSLDGPGERWERSVERWDNSPKVVRGDKPSRTSHLRSSVNNRDDGNQHARSDSGSSAGSCGETTSSAATNLAAKIQEEEYDEETIECIITENASGEIISNLKNNSKINRKLDMNYQDDKSPIKTEAESADSISSGSGSGSESEDSLSDIAEEDNINSGPFITRNFFSRNAPERLSSLLKRGVGGADEKIRGFWKKSVSRSGSKDSVTSLSSIGSVVSNVSGGDKLLSPNKSEEDENLLSPDGTITKQPPMSSSGQQNTSTPLESQSLKKGKQIESKGSSLVQSSTDKKLFNMKGEQPRLFQQSSVEEFKTPPTSPEKVFHNETSTICKFNPSKPTIVPVSHGRDIVILGDPLGALDSPSNSPRNSPPRNSVFSDPSPTVSSQIKNSSVDDESFQANHIAQSLDLEYQSDLTVASETREDISVPDPPNSLKSELNFKVSTIKATRLSPLSAQIVSPEETSINISESEKFPGEVKSKPSTSASTNELSSTLPTSSSSTPKAWSIAPMGSPFAAPLPIPLSGASTKLITSPKSSEQCDKQPPRNLPPLAPKTPNRTSTSSSSSRSSRNSNNSNRRANNRRSSSANSHDVNASAIDKPHHISSDDSVLINISSKTNPRTIQRNSNSLTSLSSAVDLSVDGVCDGPRRRGSDLAPRHAATLESNYSPAATWQQKFIRYFSCRYR